MTYAGNQNIAYSFTYDANNRITQIADSNSIAVNYTYDAAGNRTAMSIPNNILSMTYSYDNNNQISQIASNPGNFTFAYDDDSRLTGITTNNAGTTIDSATYTLDGVGNRLSKTQNSTIVDYTYDNIYRLTSASPTGTTLQAETYTYDQVGNRLTSTYELTPDVNETTLCSYDDENRLTGIQTTRNSQTQQLTFAYDPFGRRIRKTVSPFGGGAGEVTNYVYDGQNIILEYDQNGTITTRYTHGPNIDEPLAIEVKNTTSYTPYYYHADGLGSITALSNASGNIVQRYEYDSFGNQTITTNGNINQPYTFTAREYDSETGMYFYRARYYDQKAGRFVTKDPIGFAGGDINLYAYVGNNPANHIDPLGLDWLDNAANFSAGFGDTISFGLTNYIRELWDIDDVVDKCSGAYASGMYAELGLEIGLTGGSLALRSAAKGLTQAAARSGLSWHGIRGVSAVHHINPLKQGLFPTAALPRSIRHSPINLELLSSTEHKLAHANFLRHERYIKTTFNPATTAGRGIYAGSSQCSCKE